MNTGTIAALAAGSVLLVASWAAFRYQSHVSWRDYQRASSATHHTGRTAITTTVPGTTWEAFAAGAWNDKHVVVTASDGDTFTLSEDEAAHVADRLAPFTGRLASLRLAILDALDERGCDACGGYGLPLDDDMVCDLCHSARRAAVTR